MDGHLLNKNFYSRRGGIRHSKRQSNEGGCVDSDGHIELNIAAEAIVIVVLLRRGTMLDDGVQEPCLPVVSREGKQSISMHRSTDGDQRSVVSLFSAFCCSKGRYSAEEQK